MWEAGRRNTLVHLVNTFTCDTQTVLCTEDVLLLPICMRLGRAEYRFEVRA